MSEALRLQEQLRSSQERQGYYFNHDQGLTQEVLEGLLANRARYGYLACPCRLAAGDRQADRDIICPCAYREADVQEFGACYCNLYVSAPFNQQRRGRQVIPERRPPEKMGF